MLLALISTPSHAAPFNGTSGTISCSSGYVTILRKTLTSNNNCSGGIYLPEGITSIGSGAFSGATSLWGINIPSTVTSIGDSAFSGATHLEYIVYEPNSKLASIGDSAFRGANALVYITIPASVTSIGDSAFYGTPAYRLTFSTPSKLKSIGPAAFYGANRLTSVTIPASVTSIGTHAFYGAAKLETLTFATGSKLASIGEKAFYGVTSLWTINIPASVTEIEFGAFYGATRLQTLNFEKDSNLKVIGDNAFSGAVNLTSVTIPASLTYLGSAFSNSTSLASLTFEKGSKLETIRPYAFYNSTALTSVTIPARVTYLGYNAFYGARALTSVTFAKDSWLEHIGSEAFYGAINLGSLEIPANVTYIGPEAFYCLWYSECKLNSVTFEPGSRLKSIGYSAFYNATALTSITIPASVTDIGSVAFGGASSLSDVYFLGNAPEIGERAFDGIAADAKAQIRSSASGFGPIGTSWKGLNVQVGVHSVTFNSNYGSAVSPGAYIANGYLFEPMSPFRKGYTFAGWSTSITEPSLAFPYKPETNTDFTLYAKWDRNLVKAVASTKPTIIGIATSTKDGKHKLTANKGKWSGYPTPDITMQWYSCTSQVKSATAAIPKSCKKISKATKSTLAVTNAFKGKFIAVAVTGKGTGTTATTWLSKSTAKVK
jgi:uncharacterized repeat protein (TIGR02543 family)